MWIVVGLGNPDPEYEGTRHNVGRDIVEHLAKKNTLTDWKRDKLKAALVVKGGIADEKVTLVLPETYMNESGRAVRHFVPSAKAAARLAVIHDDLDLPLGKVKLSFGSGAGGHKGVESIQRAIKTKDFMRIRIGISPSTPGGKAKKPDQGKVIDFVLGKFRAPEAEKLKKARKVAEEGLEVLLGEGLGKAMTVVNSK